MNRLKNIIKNKTVCIALHGNSIKELEDNIEEFNTDNICWVSVNSFDIIEEYILNKINKKLDIIYCGAEFFPEIEKTIRIPLLIKAFENKVFVLGKEFLFTETFPNNGHKELYSKYKKQILLIEDIIAKNKESLLKILSTNTVSSLGYLLCALSIAGAKQIILFGCDGIKGTENNYLSTYYQSNTHIERRILSRFKNILSELRDEYFCGVKGDTLKFNKTFDNYYSMCMNLFNITTFPNIFNCSINSNIHNFNKISYHIAIKLIEKD